MALLNLANVPGNEISGLSTEILDFITKESENRYLLELSNNFQNELNNLEKDFPMLTPDQLEELNQIEKSSIPAGTGAQTQRHVSKFQKFLRENKLCEDFENAPDSVLNDYLRFFYSSLRTKDNHLYSPSSLVCIRASLHRHLTSVVVNREVDILHGNEYRRANGVLKGMVGKFLASNQQRKPEYEAITEVDMTRLQNYFDRSTPLKIQEEATFNLLYHFGLRGRENLRSIQRDTFVIDEDETGKRFLKLDKVLKSKNVKASLSQKEFSDRKKCRMYESTNKETCPLEAHVRYLALLPESTKDNTIFPKFTKSGFSSTAVLGKETLGNFISTLSEKANLSKRYTNHCVRVTVVSVLKSKGYSNDEVASVTGHKNVSSVQRYARHINSNGLQKVSSSLNLSREQTIVNLYFPSDN